MTILWYSFQVFESSTICRCYGQYSTDNDHSNTHQTVNTLTSEPDFQPLINGIKAVIDTALLQTSQQAAGHHKQKMPGSHMQFKLVHNSDRRNYSSPPPRAGNYNQYSYPAHNSLMTVILPLIGDRQISQINRVPVPDQKNMLSHGGRIVPSRLLHNVHSAVHHNPKPSNASHLGT